MAKKENDKNSGIFAGIVDSLKGLVMESVKSGMYNILDTIKEYVERMQKRMMMTFAYYFLLAMSIIFLSIAFINLLTEYLDLSPGWSYLIIGLILLIGGLVTKSRLKNI